MLMKLTPGIKLKASDAFRQGGQGQRRLLALSSKWSVDAEGGDGDVVVLTAGQTQESKGVGGAGYGHLLFYKSFQLWNMRYECKGSYLFDSNICHFRLQEEIQKLSAIHKWLRTKNVSFVRTKKIVNV